MWLAWSFGFLWTWTAVWNWRVVSRAPIATNKAHQFRLAKPRKLKIVLFSQTLPVFSSWVFKGNKGGFLSAIVHIFVYLGIRHTKRIELLQMLHKNFHSTVCLVVTPYKTVIGVWLHCVVAWLGFSDYGCCHDTVLSDKNYVKSLI